MKELIDRYIYDVTRRVPEKDRKELTKELESNIYDMLPDDSTEEEVQAILYELGKPSKLSEKYQKNPRYLISPNTYGDYIQTLKWLMTRIMPLLAGIDIFFDLVLGSMSDIMELIEAVVGSMLSATGGILISTTIIFAIIDRTTNKNKSKESEQEWDINDLPDLVEKDVTNVGKISRLETLFEIGVMVAAIVALLGFLLNIFNFGSEIRPLDVFNVVAIRSMLVISVISLGESIIKLVKGRWTPMVCSITTLSLLTQLAIFAYVLIEHGIFTENFAWIEVGNYIVAIVGLYTLYDYGTEIWRAIKNFKVKPISDK